MSNSVAVQQKRFLRLAPSNNSASYSPTGGQPILRFSVADTQALAFLKQARLNFSVTVDKNGSSTPPGVTDNFNMDSVLGSSSLIDQVIVSSRRFGTQIEQVVNLGRLESSFYRSKYSPKMMASNQYHLNKSVGLGRYNRYSGQQQYSSLATDLRTMAARKTMIAANWYSLPFHAGLFLQDKPLDLSSVGGLEIAVYLQKSEAAYFGSAVVSGTTYTVTNVYLTLPVLYKSSDMIAQTPPETVIDFLNWTSLYSVLDSTFSSVSHRLYLAGLVSGLHNFLPTAQLNNTNWNQFALKNIGPQRLTFTRDGQRNPMEKTAIVQENTTLTGNFVQSVEDHSTTLPEVLTDMLTAWGPTRDLVYSQTIPENVKGINNRSGVAGAVGANYSPDSAGINMSGVLGIDIQSKLESITTASKTTTEPYAMFSFYLSRKGFLASPSGLTAL